MLLQEMSHRVANSLQIIASILLMKAKIVDSPETRLHLQDAHRRVMSIASVQQHLQASGRDEQIAVALSLQIVRDPRSVDDQRQSRNFP
jgi:two-component sensor histidine kinase